MMLSVELVTESDLKHQGFSFQLKHKIITIWDKLKFSKILKKC